MFLDKKFFQNQSKIKNSELLMFFRLDVLVNSVKN